MVVLYIPLISEPARDEDHYCLQCKLNIPWRGNFESNLPPHQSWRKFHDEWLANRAAPVIDDEDFPQELRGQPDEPFENHIDEDIVLIRGAGEALARIQPGNHQVDPLGQRPIDEAHRWSDLSDANLTIEEIGAFLRTYKSAPNIDAAPKAQIIPFDRLSPEQQQVVGLCRDQILDQDHTTRRCIV